MIRYLIPFIIVGFGLSVKSQAQATDKEQETKAHFLKQASDKACNCIDSLDRR